MNEVNMKLVEEVEKHLVLYKIIYITLSGYLKKNFRGMVEPKTFDFFISSVILICYQHFSIARTTVNTHGAAK